MTVVQIAPEQSVPSVLCQTCVYGAERNLCAVLFVNPHKQIIQFLSDLKIDLRTSSNSLELKQKHFCFTATWDSTFQRILVLITSLILSLFLSLGFNFFYIYSFLKTFVSEHFTSDGNYKMNTAKNRTNQSATGTITVQNTRIYSSVIFSLLVFSDSSAQRRC